MKFVGTIPVFGEHDDATIQQIQRCADHPDVVAAALMADGHRGYSMPIGGVVTYRNSVSPSGVGYDAGCGNLAVRTEVLAADAPPMSYLMDRIYGEISFGMGRKNATPVDHPVLHESLWWEMPEIRNLRDLAAKQLGTVGSGNHYVDILADEDGLLWVAVHFGSRGVGHKIASGFLNLAAERKFMDKAPGESMDQPATVLSLDTDIGQRYYAAMALAGNYAYAGRETVVAQVLSILGNPTVTERVHNHHNYAFREMYGEEVVYTVRKGSTPSWPGQISFIGGSMGDVSYIVQGQESPLSAEAMYSTVHGAGRVMSRTAAAGRRDWKTGKIKTPGLVSQTMLDEWLTREGVTLRGGGLDESPHAYRRLPDVIKEQGDTIKILHTLRPLGVAMAGVDTHDAYKD
jgi:tRNA-splicing ligase RtcB